MKVTIETKEGYNQRKYQPSSSVFFYSEYNTNFIATYSLIEYDMGLFGLILAAVIILAVLGLGWGTFTTGVISGFEKALDIGTPIIKDLTQEAKDLVNSPGQLNTA
jgi:hypothetical protein